MALSVEYTSCGCNRSPFSADWGKNNLLAYGGGGAVIICKTKSPTKVISTLVGHKGRVNCVRWIRKYNNGPETELISGSTDNTARLWRENSGKKYEQTAVLEGHTSAVTIATGLYIGGDGDSGGGPTHPRLLVATASADSSVKIWERNAEQEDVTCIQTVSFGTGFALALSWVLLPMTNTPLLACGCDDQKVHLLAEMSRKFTPVQTLSGHEDWIRGLDFAVEDSGDILLASCSQDYYIRLWRLSARDPDTAISGTALKDLTLDGDIRMKETTFTIKDNDKSLCFAVSLESVLSGHDNWIYSIRWQSPTNQGGSPRQPLALLSASMDKTLILWRPDHETGMWIEQVRVGDVGGNTLGFYGGVFGPDGDVILGHGYHGAFHVWEQTEDKNTWLPGVTVGGHFAGVQDVAWEPEGGEFIISVSQDQTSRIHGFWKADDKDQSAWHELGRPQVHGYDMQCLAFINGWKFASGADEKVTRIFEAPRNSIENLGRLSGLDMSTIAKGTSQAPEGASIPALGLSNKAVYQDSSQASTTDREVEVTTNAQYPDVYFNPLTLNAPPSEDNLIQNTLWPEVQKLYGHGYEIFALACHPNRSILASACKAAKAEHAAILLWDTTTWRQVCKLESHSLTVTQLRFSHSGRRLLSVSRDRTWAVYRERTSTEPESDPVFVRVAYSDRKTSLHSRIIWSTAWTHDDQYFVTVSRDKKAIVWTEDDDNPEENCLGHYRPASTLHDLPDSATAVDFAPTKLCDNCYLMAVGLDNGCIHVYKWADLPAPGTWTHVLAVNQSQAHHMTVKRVQFRPVVGALGREDSTGGPQYLQLASCGADNLVRVYTINLDDLNR